MNNFAWVATIHFRFSGTSQTYFGSFKDCYQCGYYCREHYTVKSAQPESVRKLPFLSTMPLRCHIARWGTFSVDPGILLSLYASAHHPCTTLATGEWIIFWPSEDSAIEVGPTECSRHLEPWGSIRASHLKAGLQKKTKTKRTTQENKGSAFNSLWKRSWTTKRVKGLKLLAQSPWPCIVNT